MSKVVTDLLDLLSPSDLITALFKEVGYTDSERIYMPAALIGFKSMLSRQASPIVADIEKKIASSEGPVHADETYWTLDGDRACYWFHTTADLVHFEFETTRSGQVFRDVLGKDFAGTLVTDCYGGYEAQPAAAKQKCLAHLARTARDWQKLTDQ